MFGFGEPDHPQYPIISIICAAIILLPISSHWKARNVATLSMIAWLFTMNITRFISTLVWANNVIPRWKVWCDITTKLTIGVTIALPAAALCICKYLEEVAAIRTRHSKADKRRRMKFETAMCFGLPILIMALHYITQGHRYDLYEDFGCSPSTVITWVAILILYIPPLILSLIAFVYAGLAIRHFYHRRLDFQRLLKASNSGMTANRYVRLMLLALTEMIVDTSVNIWILVSNIAVWGVVPYTSWADIHSNFSRIQPYPEIVVPVGAWRNTIAAWYIIPIATVLFWSFFAFGQESMAEYRAWWNWIQRKVLRRDIAPLTSNSPPSAPKLDSNVLSRSSNGKSKTGFLSKLSFGKLGNSAGAGFNSSGSSDSPITPTTPRGGRFELQLKDRGNTMNSNHYSVGSDNDSFCSADEKTDKPLPLSPISPMTPVSQAARIPLSYNDCNLDTSVFDTISHVTIPSISEPATTARSVSPEIQDIGDAYHPSLHGAKDYTPSSPAFHDTAVPRPITPSNPTENVKVQVDIDVV